MAPAAGQPVIGNALQSEKTFVGAYLLTDQKNIDTVTHEDLDELSVGEKIAILMAEVIYKDNGVTDHQRERRLLQIPARAPGI